MSQRIWVIPSLWWNALAALCLLSFFSAEWSAAGFPFREAYPLKDAGGPTGEAVLRIENPELQSGEKLKFELKYCNGGYGSRFFNPFFNSLLPAPAAIAIYNDRHEYVSDCIEWRMGSRRLPGAGDSVFIPGPGFVGVSFDRVPMNEKQYGLPAGKYYLQAVYFRAFINFTKVGTRETAIDRAMSFYNGFDRSEIFRSNVAEFTIRDRAAK